MKSWRDGCINLDLKTDSIKKVPCAERIGA